MNLVREPDAVNPPVRFDEREVETEHGMRIFRHARGNLEMELSRSLPHRATSRLYPFSCPGGFPRSLGWHFDRAAIVEFDREHADQTGRTWGVAQG